MLFNSSSFLFFVLLVFFLYYTKPLIKHQVIFLTFSSLIFYAWEHPWYLILLISSAAINILVSFKVVKTSNNFRRKQLATVGVIVNLCILSVFKYSNLLADTFFSKNSDIGAFLIQLPLPIGISFFTFEGISLLVDVYKERNFKDYSSIVSHSLWSHSNNVLLFITFFPHLIAGPILKANDFIPQTGAKQFKDIHWQFCFRQLILGFFLKMVIADNLKDQTFWIQFPYFEGHSSLTLAMLLLGYSVQIFSDFAGYSLIALGIAALFGYRLDKNFNFPYISSSFSEFWTRWHISLSSFLKEYLYIPLGGNRKGILRTYFNLMLTMILGGLWHGGALSYAIWGSFHGIALVTERFLKTIISLPSGIVILTCKRLIVFMFITLAWLLFKLPDFSHVIRYIQCFFLNTSTPNDYSKITYVMLYSSPIFLYHSLYLLKEKKIFNVLFRKVQFVWYGILLFLIITNSGSTGTFIYFQF